MELQRQTSLKLVTYHESGWKYSPRPGRQPKTQTENRLLVTGSSEGSVHNRIRVERVVRGTVIGKAKRWGMRYQRKGRGGTVKVSIESAARPLVEGRKLSRTSSGPGQRRL